jgi:hypothetical protein
MKIHAARNKNVRPTRRTNADGMKKMAKKYIKAIGKHQYDIYLILFAVSKENGFVVFILCRIFFAWCNIEKAQTPEQNKRTIIE